MTYFIIYIFILFCIFSSVIPASKRKKSKTKVGMFYGIAIILMISMLVPVFTHLISFDDSKKVEPADGFDINKYVVKLDVKENNTIDVEEDIKINWLEYGHHGIYKFTPEWLQYTSKNGKTIRRKSALSNLRAEAPEYFYNPNYQYNVSSGVNYTNDESIAKIAYEKSYNYSVDVVKKKPRIKIGSSSVELGTGEKDYIIKYTYDMGSDPYDGYDEFIFHAYGDFWGTKINNPSIEVTMPKSIEGNTVHFFTDKKRKCDVTKYVDYSINNNKLVANFNSDRFENDGYYLEKSGCPYQLDKALTVDIELPDNYFSGGSFNYGYKSLTCTIICLIILFIIFILWLIFGKDYFKKERVVTYLPPKDLSSAEIGYAYKNSYSNKLVISLIVELASKGLIEIREEKKKIYIKGQKPNKDDKNYEKNLEKYNKRVKELNEYEQIVLDELITDSNEFKLKDHKTFYKVFDKIEDKLEKEYRWSINEKAGFVLRYITLVLVFISCVLMIFSYSVFEDMPQKMYFMYYLGYISVFISFFITIFMTRRSRFGEDIRTEIDGFKHFLEVVEKNKLEELVEEIPNYFYKILPYTYVLGISKKWINKFEDIKSVDTTVIPFTTFDYIDTDIYTPAPASSSGSSGGSSCGGGCSSCGGGCSSCGGGGSW